MKTSPYTGRPVWTIIVPETRVGPYGNEYICYVHYHGDKAITKMEELGAKFGFGSSAKDSADDDHLRTLHAKLTTCGAITPLPKVI